MVVPRHDRAYKPHARLKSDLARTAALTAIKKGHLSCSMEKRGGWGGKLLFTGRDISYQTFANCKM